MVQKKVRGKIYLFLQIMVDAKKKITDVLLSISLDVVLEENCSLKGQNKMFQGLK